MEIKRCPTCGGAPQFVYYALPCGQFPDAWEETEDGPEPIVLLKRIECSNCKASTPGLVLSCDEAVQMWDDGDIVVFDGTESVEDA